MRSSTWMATMVTAAALTLATGAVAGQTKTSAAKAEDAKTMTVQGEIVDMGCYLGHGAKGAQHKSCATKCIAGGMPMGLLTTDGKLYLLTMSHENADPFNSAKDLAAETVTITGPVHERDGILSLEVTSLEKAAAKS